jgi:Ca-activated chloride channel family protein
VKAFSFVLSSLVVLACAAPSQSPNAKVPVGQNPVEPIRNGSSTPGTVVASAEGPAHLFTPRVRSPHPHAAPTFVDVSRLPPLRLRSCFTEDEPASVARARPRSSAPPPGVQYFSGAGSAAGSSGSLGRSAKGAAVAPAKKSAAEGAPMVRSAPPPPAPALPSEAFKDEAASAAPAAAEAPLAAVAAPEAPAAYHDLGASIYLSNDDTMSLSSAQRVIFAIDRFLPIPREHIRPHELLNYFSFETAPVASNDDFSVLANIDAKPGEPGAYTLGLSVSGRSVSKAERRNAAITFVVDRSGSMASEGRMEYLKRGLLRMTSELKRGDMVNMVLFDHQTCVPVENFVVGRDSMQTLTGTIRKLTPRGSTDIDLGLRLGYSLADKGYQPTHSNRVMLITDALANTGVTDSETISLISSYYDQRRIRLSGVGVGTEFNDELLDRLTERGKGAYVFLGSPSEVDAVFGERFVSLIETTANDVHFKLQLPPSLRMNVFYGEESSTVKEDVQAIHYFADTSQLFLSDLAAKNGELRKQDSVMLSVEYEDPETGRPEFEDFVFNLGAISEQNRMVKKARLVMSFIDGLADTVQSSPERSDYRAGGWVDSSAARQCSRGRASLAEQAQPFARDPEVQRVVALWDKYCSRYDRAREPVRRTPPRGHDVWPSAAR